MATRQAWCSRRLKGTGPWPGVIFFMDGPGLRPAMWEMVQRLAASSHLFVDGIAGRVYVAGAIEDGSFTDEQKPDLSVYDAAAAERHWTALFGLLDAKLPY